MPAIAQLSVNDGQATPVAHTFAVQGTTGLKATWLEKSAGVPTGYIKVTAEYREAKSATGAHSWIISYEMPTLATIDGVLTRVRVSSASQRWNFAQDSTDAERKDLVAYTINLPSNAAVRPSLYNLEPFY